MAKKGRLLIFIFFSIIIFEAVSWAEPLKLLKMTGDKQKDLSRFSFFFDQMPEFNIETSGQRIRLILDQTNFSSSFIPLSPDEVIFQINSTENVKDSVVDIYLRNIPQFVDVTVDEKSVRLIINIFWDQKRLGRRPAIQDKKIGNLKPIKGGTLAQKVISSQYSGRWIEFFKEFESPLKFSLPINFSFPQIPSPLVVENSAYLPPQLLQKDMEKLCTHVGEKLASLLPEDSELLNSDIYNMIWAECLLRKKDNKTALDVLRQVNPEMHPSSLKNWRIYYQNYAHAVSGHYYRAATISRDEEERLLEIKSLAPWYRIFQAELELAKGKPDKALQILCSEIGIDEVLTRIYLLRKADSLHELGQAAKAFELYEEMVSDLIFFQDYSCSMAKRAETVYGINDFSEAYRDYLILSVMLKDKFPAQQALAKFRSAMAILKQGGKDPARLLFTQITEKNAGTEAEIRARLKLVDLKLLDDLKTPLSDILNEYSKIAELGPTRMLREEAFFKKILACHLYGENLRAIKFLGRFFKDFWAGELIPEAQALFIEIFPDAVQALINQESPLIALSLVAKHRDLLAQAQIDYDFLQNLANHYLNSGFLAQAEKTYLYMLDFEKNKERKEDVFFRLIKTCHQQDKHDQVEHYASYYFRKYPEGSRKGQILYYLADVLIKKGEINTVVGLLLEKNRPINQKLDHLAGNLFFEMEQYELADHYLSKAYDVKNENVPPDIILQRAEANYSGQNWEKAIGFYESLLDKPPYNGQAAYRLISTFFHLGKNEQAIKLYGKLTELPIEKPWLTLAAETVQTQNLIKDN